MFAFLISCWPIPYYSPYSVLFCSFYFRFLFVIDSNIPTCNSPCSCFFFFYIFVSYLLLIHYLLLFLFYCCCCFLFISISYLLLTRFFLLFCFVVLHFFFFPIDSLLINPLRFVLFCFVSFMFTFFITYYPSLSCQLLFLFCFFFLTLQAWLSGLVSIYPLFQRLSLYHVDLTAWKFNTSNKLHPKGRVNNIYLNEAQIIRRWTWHNTHPLVITLGCIIRHCTAREHLTDKAFLGLVGISINSTMTPVVVWLFLSTMNLT